MRRAFVVLIAVASVACASQQGQVMRADDPPPRVRRKPLPQPEESGAWNQPRDRRQFSEWPDVQAASSAAVDKLLGVADRHFDREDYHSAIDAYSQAIRLDPELAYAYCNRGSAKRRLEDFEGAMADLSVAIRLRPDYALAYNNRGYARLKSGDPAGAIEDFGQAIEIGDQGFPSYSLAMTYRNRARAWREIGELEKAEEDEQAARRSEGRRRVN